MVDCRALVELAVPEACPRRQAPVELWALQVQRAPLQLARLRNLVAAQVGCRERAEELAVPRLVLLVRPRLELVGLAVRAVRERLERVATVAVRAVRAAAP